MSIKIFLVFFIECLISVQKQLLYLIRIKKLKSVTITKVVDLDKTEKLWLL